MKSASCPVVCSTCPCKRLRRHGRLSLLHHTLGEDARQPRYIARCIAWGIGLWRPSPPRRPPPPAPPPRLVSRAAELAQLHAGFAQALRGTRQTVFVLGEAGMGKTA